ncbi:hypothetical protein AA0488_2434 [Kozakia baliensis NRIC 0488]|nr:hypothetical protein AA0488_2434 [Kozakia baliensis NRIC 0488]
MGLLQPFAIPQSLATHAEREAPYRPRADELTCTLCEIGRCQEKSQSKPWQAINFAERAQNDQCRMREGRDKSFLMKIGEGLIHHQIISI